MKKNKFIIKKQSHNYDRNLTFIGLLVLLLNITLVNNESIQIIFYVISYILIGYKILFNSLKSIFQKNVFDENVLMTIATIGALFIGEYTEAIAVLIFYKIGDYLQHFAVDNSRKRIESALSLKPELANLKTGNKIEVVKPETLKLNDVIIVKTGEKIPVDGVVIKGTGMLDTAALTGESIPKSVGQSETVLSGSINLGPMLEIKVTSTYDESAIFKVIHMIENANQNKSETEKFMTTFSKFYTPVIVFSSLLIFLIPTFFFNYHYTVFLKRALIFLVISCPCALVLSIPLSYFAGVGTSSKNGVLIKGSSFLDELLKVDTVIFDKTGTLTKGNFKVTEVVSLSEFSENDIVKYISICESFSTHPIANAILEYNKNPINQSIVENHKEEAGYGITAKINNKLTIVGNMKLLQKHQIKINQHIEERGTVVYLAVDNELKGYIIIADEIKNESKKTIKQLRKNGITKIVMLTGDNKNIANEIGYKLSIDDIYSELLPGDKLDILNKIKANQSNKNIMFVGDGINDGPVLAASDIGVSLSSGSDLAIETSDILLISNEINKILDAIDIAKKTRKIVIQNIIFSLSIKILFLILSALGMTSMWGAVLADVGVTIVAVGNSIRIMTYSSKY